MRYLFLLPLALILITSCSKSDREALNGKWSYEEIRDGKNVLYSSDKTQIKKIIEKRMKDEGAMYAQMGIDESMLRENMEKSFEAQAKYTFNFTEKDTLTISANNGQADQDVKMKFKMDDKKKQLIFKENGQDTKFTYTLEDDKLVLKQDKSEIHMIRKGE